MNEKGFIYPTALCLLLVMTTLFLYEVSVSISEQRMIHEIKTQETRQYILLRASRQMTETIRNTPDLSDGSIQIDSGLITYTIVNLSPTQLQVNFLLRHEGVQIQAVAIYENGSGKLVNWLVPI